MKFLSLLFVFSFFSLLSLNALASETKETRFNIEVVGKGTQPNAPLEMISGGKTTTKTRSKNDGSFGFPILSFDPERSLNLMFSLPQKAATPQGRAPNTMISVSFNPYKGTAEVSGLVTSNAMIVGNMSAEDSFTAIANEEGRFNLRLSSKRGIEDEPAQLVLSIVNVTTISCCPKAYIPSQPILLTIRTVKPALTKKSESEVETRTHDFAFTTRGTNLNLAVSVPQEKMEESWLKALRNFATRLQAFQLGQSGFEGGFLDAEINLIYRLAQLKQETQSKLNAQVGEQVCTAASLTQSLGAADSNKIAQQRALAQIMLERDLGKPGSISFGNDAIELEQGLRNRFELFKESFCDEKDENTSLEAICKTELDTNLNRDVDFTRVIDTPLTLKVDFVEEPIILDDDEPDVTAIAENLFPSFPLEENNSAQNKTENYMQFRGLQAARNIAKNSLAAIVGEKSMSGGQSAHFMKQAVSTIMKDEEEAAKIIGDNPSYFAQMEVLTKTLYQTPQFVANLMTNEANILRTRIAMKAIELQQDNDLLNSLHRREMLLAAYLEQLLNDSIADNQTDRTQGN